jgi:hypothetical protein
MVSRAFLDAKGDPHADLTRVGTLMQRVRAKDFCNEQSAALNQRLPANFTLLGTCRRAGMARPVT